MQLPVFDFDQTLPGGFRMPARMTVLPMEGRRLALVSPVPIDEAMGARIDALGEVAYLVAPNLLHHLHLGAAIDRFRTAKVLAPAGLRAKRPDLRVDAALEDGLPDDLAGAVRAVKIEGAPSIDEFVFFHAATGTLVVTDLLFNVVRPRGLVANVVLWMVGCHGRLAQSRAWRFGFVNDRALAGRSARAVLALPFDRLVPAHGEVVPSGAHASVSKALAWMANGAGTATARSSTRSTTAAP